MSIPLPAQVATTSELAYYSTTSDAKDPHVTVATKIVLVANVTPTTGTVPVDGNVTFFDGITKLTTQRLYPGPGEVSYAILYTTLGAGLHTIRAAYSGSSTFDAGSSTVDITVSK
jgi:hypothetical protein